MTTERQRLALLALLQDFKRNPAQSDLEAALDRILAQREEITRLETQLAEARRGLPMQQFGLRQPFSGRPLRVIRGGAA